MVPDTAAPRAASPLASVRARNLAGRVRPGRLTCNSNRGGVWLGRAFPRLLDSLGVPQAVHPAAPSRMQTSPRTAAQAPAARHLVLYDGDCGFCRSAVLAVARLDPAGSFQFASLNSDLAGNLLAERRIAPRGAGTMYVLPEWQRHGQSVLDRAAAALFIAGGLAWPWKGLAALGILPRRFLNRCYDAVARNRHRLVRGTDACAMPEAAVQDRFLTDRQGGQSRPG